MKCVGSQALWNAFINLLHKLAATTDVSFCIQIGRILMKNIATLLRTIVLPLFLISFTLSANAGTDWSALPGGCASTDNNFHNGPASPDYPIARHATPGASLTFNAFHDGYIAVICNVDNPRFSSTTPNWNQLQITYRDPDGLQGLQGKGTEYQAYVELVRVSKTTGVWGRVASFDSNLQCSGTSISCQGDNTVKNIAVSFSHSFDFNNYSYAVYGRLYRGIAIYNLRPALYQLRLQTQNVIMPPVLPPVLQSTIIPLK
jgi:hypothetical protein